jgi:hypothetical protein
MRNIAVGGRITIWWIRIEMWMRVNGRRWRMSMCMRIHVRIMMMIMMVLVVVVIIGWKSRLRGRRFLVMGMVRMVSRNEFRMSDDRLHECGLDGRDDLVDEERVLDDFRWLRLFLY